MLKNNRANKYEQPYSGPHCITQVNTNGTVHLKINAVTDTVNIHVSIHSRLPIPIVGASAVCAKLEIGGRNLVSDNLNLLVWIVLKKILIAMSP
jgi:hypothetical protein